MPRSTQLSTLAHVLARETREGELYERLPDGPEVASNELCHSRPVAWAGSMERPATPDYAMRRRRRIVASPPKASNASVPGSGMGVSRKA